MLTLNLQFPNDLTEGHYRIFRSLIKSRDLVEIGQTETSAHFEARSTKGRTFCRFMLTQSKNVTVS